jgi:diaminohydroxyphosphoribosylaminopyrimidine deaminase/5-amino-6-(5-phosphoribosylamino)uracil reductase
MEKERSRGRKAHMLRALELALKARGRTSPNPMVGAVVVRGERVVGEGYHRHAGGIHAEVGALRKAGAAARGADLYVNLEPCSHQGRTPPCTEAIIRAGIGRVFAAVKDPNPLVSGEGGRQLRRAGISVRFGLAAPEARRANESYLKYIRTGLPFVFVKSAISLDGKTATKTGDSRWITGGGAREKVHELRDGADAIMVGIGTVRADDPSLTTRLPAGSGSDPVRVIIDPLLRLPRSAKVLNRGAGAGVVVVTGRHAPPERAERLRVAGAELLVVEGAGKRIDMRRLMEILGRRGMTSVMIEGGSEVAASAFEAGVVDKVVYFIAPKIIGGRDAPTAVGGEGITWLRDAIRLRDMRVSPLEGDFMVEGYVQGGDERCSPV